MGVYQGFNGKNYEEDDIERQKAGGIVGGFKPSPTPEVQNTDEPVTLKNQYNAEAERIKMSNANDRLRIDALDKIRRKIMHNQDEMDLIDNEASADPRFAEDYANGTEDHKEEFMKQYPDYMRMLEEKEKAEAEYDQDPLNQKHMEEVKKLNDLNTDPRFKKIRQQLK
jgi:hypothetical protein